MVCGETLQYDMLIMHVEYSHSTRQEDFRATVNKEETHREKEKDSETETKRKKKK